jgi:hypothetical protein
MGAEFLDADRRTGGRMDRQTDKRRKDGRTDGRHEANSRFSQFCEGV